MIWIPVAIFMHWIGAIKHYGVGALHGLLGGDYPLGESHATG
jgi:hypothetical protein